MIMSALATIHIIESMMHRRLRLCTYIAAGDELSMPQINAVHYL